MAMHGWTVAALALTAALATGAIAWPASLKTGVGAAVAAHLTVPATVDKQLRSLFTVRGRAGYHVTVRGIT